MAWEQPLRFGRTGETGHTSIELTRFFDAVPYYPWLQKLMASSTITTVLFPVFASYKALRTSDPAQLTPWLMYWVVLSIAVLIESTFSFVLGWVPFYSWMRLFAHLYLVMPGQQGATQIYQIYIHPFLEQHEYDIDTFISEAHNRAKAAGLQYLKQAIEFVKVNVLGMQPKPPTPPPSRQTSYVQNLLSRFNLPTARERVAAPAGDFYGLLSSTLQTATSGNTSREAVMEDLTGTLIPSSISSDEERMTYISTQREKLRLLLQAFDKEASNFTSGPSHPPPPPPEAEERVTEDKLAKSRSELDFDKIERDEAAHDRAAKADKVEKVAATGGWMPWNWGGKSAAPAPSAKPEEKTR